MTHGNPLIHSYTNEWIFLEGKNGTLCRKEWGVC